MTTSLSFGIETSPITYEVSPCQEINYPYERFFSFPKKLPLRQTG